MLYDQNVIQNNTQSNWKKRNGLNESHLGSRNQKKTDGEVQSKSSLVQNSRNISNQIDNQMKSMPELPKIQKNLKMNNEQELSK